jgi:hypothetical protein
VRGRFQWPMPSVQYHNTPRNIANMDGIRAVEMVLGKALVPAAGCPTRYVVVFLYEVGLQCIVRTWADGESSSGLLCEGESVEHGGLFWVTNIY